MKYEDLKYILENGLLIREDTWVDERGTNGVTIDWSKESMKELQKEFGDLNELFKELCEFDPESDPYGPEFDPHW